MKKQFLNKDYKKEVRENEEHFEALKLELETEYHLKCEAMRKNHVAEITKIQKKYGVDFNVM